MKKKLLFCVVIITACCNVEAQWSGNPEIANTKVCTAPGDQNSSNAITDGSGGAIIFWLDNSGSGGENIFFNKINSAGNAVWHSTVAGIALTNTADYNYIDQVISDGNGGAFICWETDTEIFVQHINNVGSPTWAPAGISLSSTGSSGSMCSDGNNGVIIVWSDVRNNLVDGFPQAYIQRINSSGIKQWATGGIQAITSAGVNAPIGIISDGSGGAIIAMGDTRNSNYNAGNDEYDNIDIYGQRVNASGGLTWGTDGLPICTSSNNQYYDAARGQSYVISDGSGGAVICWEDYRNDINNGNASPYNSDIYCQRINSNGAPYWASGGVALCTAGNSQDDIFLMPDGTGGAIAIWKDERSNYGLYTQKINGSGVTQWASNGLAVVSAVNGFEYSATPDVTGSSFLISWADPSNSPQDIRAQKISASDGSLLWGSGGTLVCGRSDAQTEPSIINDGGSGAIISWTDARNSGTTGSDIYINRVLSAGVLPVTLINFEAIDLKNYVSLKWSTVSEINSDNFFVQRSLDGEKFETISKVAAAGNSNSLRNYSFDDWGIKALKSSILFYRIQSNDYDGKLSYSEIKKVVIENSKNKFILLSNPVRSEALFSFDSQGKGDMDIRLVDYFGRTVLNKDLLIMAGNNQIKLPLNNIAKGIYSIELRGKNERYLIRMIKE
ncbi:MAG: hypothetical protein ABIP35_05935 [Ginsengibacter sp.]